MKKKILAVALALSLAAFSAEAGTISFNFSGTWTSVDSMLKDWFISGDLFRGTISYESTTSVHPFYVGGPMTFSTTDATGTMKWSGSVNTTQIRIYNYNQSDSLNNDQFGLRFFAASSGVTISSTLPAFENGSFSLRDSNNTAFSDTSLPSGSIWDPYSSPFESGMFNLLFKYPDRAKSGGYGYLPALGIIDIAKQSPPEPTPEPASCLLFMTGLTALAAYRRR